jgi:hypothetical protein
LSHPSCRSLLQRISTRYHIEPLDLEGTHEYVAAALKMAGAENGQKIFANNVVKAIHHYSEGYPRMINILADNVLLLAYSRGQRKITPSMVKESYDELRPESAFAKDALQTSEALEIEKSDPLQIRRRLKWAAILFFLIALLAASVSHQGRNTLRRLTNLIPLNHQRTADKIGQEQILVRKKIGHRTGDGHKSASSGAVELRTDERTPDSKD